MDLKNEIVLNLKNIQGKRISRKLVVIECDDWGSIRMPSLEVYNKLLHSRIPLSRNVFNKYDTLADKSDLDSLFDVLLSVRDKNEHAAVITAMTNVANPDFRRILASEFEEYFYEPFTETLVKYNRHPDTFNTWKKGIELGIFIPEMHGREHIAVQFWLRELKEGNRIVREGFSYEFIAVSHGNIDQVLDQFRPEFYFNNNNQIPFLQNSIVTGISLFRELFGYFPRIFVPANSVFHHRFEKTLAECGVRYLYGNTLNPVPGKNGRIKYVYFKNGKRTLDNLIYYTRNCSFEPADPRYRGIDNTLKQVAAAFRWNKPANISTHRVNFVGGIDIRNRERSLRELKKLLDSIIRIWPDVEFKSSAEMLGELYPLDEKS